MPSTTESTPAAAYNPPIVDQVEGDRLAGEITRLSAHITAAKYRFLLLIREFDEKEYWGEGGVCSCAHWLNFKCGIGMNAAREMVRVAHALEGLPKISERFRTGALSYSKVRAMTRIADESNEDYLLMIGKHGTAHHVEKLVSLYRTCVGQQDAQMANHQHARRELSIRYDHDGSVIIKGRFPAEQGELIKKALEMAEERAERQAIDVTVGSVERDPFGARRADALADMAESYLNSPSPQNSTADRYQVVVHVAAGTLKEDVTAVTSEPGVTAVTSAHINDDLSHIEDGPHVSAETSRRIACDCSTVEIKEDTEGEPLNVGRKTRSIPPALRRALRTRDKGCRFPGCTHTHFIDGHHIKHWADGGETNMDNLLQLCRHHHRLVHEGGFGCERLDDGNIVFKDLRDQTLPASPCTVTADENLMIEGWVKDWMPDVDIDENTCVPLWYAGDTMDWDMAVGHLFQ